MSHNIGGFIHVGLDLLTTTVNQATGRIIATTGNVKKNTRESDSVEWWQHVGLASRPPNPEAGKQAAQAVILKTSDRDVAIASVDQRGLGLYGNLKAGETCAYAAGADGESQGRTLWKGNGSITHFTTSDNTVDGEAVYSRTSPTAFEWVAPWGVMKFDSSGFHINHASGARFDLGGISGMPSPLDQLSSYVRIQASSFISNSTCQSFGADAGHQPLASATAVKALFAAMQAEIVALQAAVAALQSVPTVSIVASTGAAATASAAAITAATATMATIQTTVLDTNTSST